MAVCPPFTVLAFADEAIADASVLQAWGASFRAADDATLAVYAPGWDGNELLAALSPPYTAAGLDRDGAPDIVALPVTPSADQAVELAGTVSAVLSRRAAAGVFGFVPWFAPEAGAQLRAAATAPAPPARTRRHALAICSVVCQEGPYLREFVEFHRLVGVEHFYLYDNGSTDETHEVLAPYVDQGVATLIDFPGPVVQLAAYNHCASTFRDEAEWIAFMDADEFFFAPGGGDLRDALREFEGYGGVHVNYANYGTSGHETRPGGPLIEAYTLRARDDAAVPYPHLLKAPGLDPADPGSYHALNAHVSSVIRPDRVERCVSPHYWRYRPGWFAVTENHERHEGPITARVSMSKLRMNHYWTKSVEECRRKFERGLADQERRRVWPEEFLRRNTVLNDVADHEILVHADRLRTVLAY
jgi:glycosyltransferase involved in cell wall biosynthesis